MRNPRDNHDDEEQPKPDWEIHWSGRITLGEIIVIVALVMAIGLHWALA